MWGRWLGILLVASVACPAAQADEVIKFEDLKATVTGGVLSGKAQEFVYTADGSTLSRLDYKMKANPTMTGRLSFVVTPRISFEALATVGLSGNNRVDNYDWAWSDTADWTDHSWHDDTELDHYISLNFAGRYDVFKKNDDAVGLVGGFKYTDVQWTAKGGCFTYTDVDFRDWSDCFVDGEKVGTFRQKLPAAFAGLGYSHDGERFDFGLSVVAGATVHGKDRDNHWLRDLVFVDRLGMSPYLGLTANASYAISDRLDLTFLADFSRFFTAKGPEKEIDTTTGDATYYGGNAAGGNLGTINLSLGLTYRF